MPNAIDVTPGRWANIQVLFDDGNYSAIWGDFSGEGQATRAALGVRWNGYGPKPGYPNMGGNPLWFVEPDYLIIPILRGLHTQLFQQPSSPQQAEYLRSIEKLLGEFASK